MTGLLKSWKHVALSVALAGGMAGFAGVANAQSDSTASVRRAQRELRNDGYYTGTLDGVDGPMTHSAIRKYQTDQNLTANGRLDRETRDHLGMQSSGEANRSMTAEPAPFRPAISAAQRSLRHKGFYKGRIDGSMGPETHAAIREYQRNSRLNVTGQLDEATLNSLGVSK